MKKRLIPVVASVLALAVVSAVWLIQATAGGKNGELKYNGRIISDENVTVYQKTAQVPFVEVLKASGANVVWLNDDQAVVYRNGKEYKLNLSEPSFVEKNGNFDMIETAPGSKHYYCKTTDKEILLDIDTVRIALELMGEDIGGYTL